MNAGLIGIQPMTADQSVGHDPAPILLLLIFEFERYLDLGAIRFDLAIGDLHVEFDNLRDAKVPQTL